MKNKKSSALIFAAWIMLLAVILFSAFTLLFGDKKLVSGEEYAVIRRYQRLDEVRQVLLEQYYLDLNEDELMQGAIKGMAAAVGDEYTVYFTPEEMQANDLELNGEYSGVGMLLERGESGDVEVIRVYDDSPASEAGILPGDIIVDINGMNLAGIDASGFEAAVSEIRGESGTQLSVQVLRSGKTLSFELTRREVVISNINYRMLDGNIAYIDIVQFGGNAVSGFREAREALGDASALIIDVRNNPGGMLEDVVSIADEILDGGMIVYMEEKDGSRDDYYAESGAWNIPVVVLTNEMSASASEILAAAVQDNNRGTVIGTKTFGKGIVQSLMTFEDDGAGLQYTFARYFTPAGRDIHKIGVMPDIVVESEAGFVHDGEADMENDIQLARAAEYLFEVMEKNGHDQ